MSTTCVSKSIYEYQQTSENLLRNDSRQKHKQRTITENEFQVLFVCRQLVGRSHRQTISATPLHTHLAHYTPHARLADAFDARLEDGNQVTCTNAPTCDVDVGYSTHASLTVRTNVVYVRPSVCHLVRRDLV